MSENPNQARWSFRTTMLTTVSAVAMAAMVASGPAQAGERESYLSFEVNGDFIAGNRQIWAINPGNKRIRPDVGLSVRFGYVTPFRNTPYDIGIFARFGATEREKQSAAPAGNVLGGLTQTGYSRGRAKHRERHIIVDFEARRDFGFGSGDEGVRITAKGGLRFGYFDADTDTTFSTPGAYLAMEFRNSRFIGAGPRLGAEAAVPILRGNLQLDLSAAGSLLLGDKQRTVKSKQPIGATFLGFNTDNQHSFRMLPMIDASAAVSLEPFGADVMTISLGVRGEAWFNVQDQRTKFPTAGGSISKKHALRVNFGPFLRVKVPLGGG